MKQAIVIIGGYNSIWTAYLRMARELQALTGLPVVAVPLMPWHWWRAERAKQATGILQRLEQTLDWARRRHHARRYILVGHSAGGLIARLYLSDRPVWNRIYRGVERVSMVVTLGTPHCDSGEHRTGWYLSDAANELAPGTPFAHRVRYHTVAGRCMLGDPAGTWKERRAYRSYVFFCGQGDSWGDGVVPLASAGLDGAESVILPQVSHSKKYGGAWYGSSGEVVRRWWPDGVSDGR